MEQSCATDVVKVAKELKALLVAHDKAVRKMTILDRQIASVSRALLLGDLYGQQESTCLHHLQLSVLGGVRNKLDAYRLLKLQQVQALSQAVIGSLSQTATADSDVQTPSADPHRTSETSDNTDITTDSAAISYTSFTASGWGDTVPADLNNTATTVDMAAINYTTLSRECYRAQ